MSINKIEIVGLNEIKEAIDKLPKEKDPGIYKLFSKEDIRFNQTIEIQEKQIKIQEQQGELIKQQTKFSKLLMLATIVLAIGSFLQTVVLLINIPQEVYKNIVQTLGYLGGVLLLLGLVFLLLLMGGIIYLIFMAFTKDG